MQRIYGFVQEEDGVVSRLLTEISAYFEYLAHQHGDYVAFHNVKIPMEGYMAQLAPYNINRNPYCLYVKSKPEVWNTCIARQGKVVNCCASGPFCGTCYAGMGEFVFPVLSADGAVLCFLSVSGYCMDEQMSMQKMRHFARKYDLQLEKLKEVYQESVRTDAPQIEELRVRIAPLCNMFALLHRELAHFAANPAYMLNCGLGTFLMPICAVAVLWKGGSLFAMLDALFADTEGSVPVMLCVLLCGLASMNLMTAPSVSLEGKSLWLMQSLPVEPWQALRAKLRMQVLLTVPPLLLCAVCAAIVYPLGLVGLLVMAVFAASYALLGALAGLTLGVKMPVLTWTDQLMPIKQSAPVMLTLFGGMGYTILLFAGFLLLPGWRLGFAGYAACFAAANLLLCAVLHRWLRKKGAALFAAL